MKRGSAGLRKFVVLAMLTVVVAGTWYVLTRPIPGYRVMNAIASQCLAHPDYIDGRWQMSIPDDPRHFVADMNVLTDKINCPRWRAVARVNSERGRLLSGTLVGYAEDLVWWHDYSNASRFASCAEQFSASQYTKNLGELLSLHGMTACRGEETSSDGSIQLIAKCRQLAAKGNAKELADLLHSSVFSASSYTGGWDRTMWQVLTEIAVVEFAAQYVAKRDVNETLVKGEQVLKTMNWLDTPPCEAPFAEALGELYLTAEKITTGTDLEVWRSKFSQFLVEQERRGVRMKRCELLRGK